MERPILSDKSQFPTEETIFSHIGKTRNLWIGLFDHIRANHPDLTEEWRYYNDGKSWLMKVTKKSKTVFWLSILDGSFKTTFYFNDRAEPAVLGSGISDELKEQFMRGKRFGKIRGITVAYRHQSDVEQAKKLIALKLACK